MKKSLFLIEVFIIAFLSPLSKEERINEILPTYSYIELTINGTGNTSIFYINENNENCQGVIPPDEIQINDETSIQNPNMMQYLNNEKNYVKLIWNNKRINSLRCLFYNCQNISYVDFTHFDSSLVESVSSLFNGCTKLTSANFNNFNPSIIIDMHLMFHNCNYLKSIDLSNFDTSKVTDMAYLFYSYYRLEFINLTGKFDTSNVTNMNRMFYGCRELTSINLSNFNTSNVKNMEYIFSDCYKLKNLDLSNFDTSKVTTMKLMFQNDNELFKLSLSNFDISNVENLMGMFSGCKSIELINLSSFDTSKVKDMSYMFRYCNNLKSIDLSHFNTTNVESMKRMFFNCENLISLDISDFDTTNIIWMDSMFENCEKLISINFVKSKAPKLYDIRYLFENCESLISIDLSNFEIRGLFIMHGLFINCKSLTSINLSNLHNYIHYMLYLDDLFSGCVNLEYINLQNIRDINRLDFEKIFKDIPKNLVICLSQENGEKFKELMNITNNENCYTIYCGDDWIKHQKKLINGTNTCINSCNNSINYEFEFNGKCYNSCEYGFYYDKENSQQKKCKCNLEKCLLCSNVDSVKDLCLSCNDLYYPIENDPTNILTYINCYKEPEGYYLDIDIYKECYYTCKTCKIRGNDINHKCIKCKNNCTFELEDNDSLNCYENCSYYYYFDENMNYFCTDNELCPDTYSKLIPNERKCIKNCSLDNIYKYEFRNMCYSECPKESKETKDNYCEALCDEENPFLIVETQECVDFCELVLITKGLCKYKYKMEIGEGTDEKYNDMNEEEKKAQEIKMQNKILENLEKGFTSDKYDTTNVENGKDDVFETKTITITLTTTENQKNQSSGNVNTTTIDLCECEDLLRKAYNISDVQKLYMKKIDVIQDGLKIPYVQYEIYSKLNGNNLVKLNLTVCKNSKVDISIPITISENFDKLNANSKYYNDICYISSSNSGTDIILKDRKEKYIIENKTICQDGCDFSDYDYKNKKALCSCDVKEYSNNYADMKIDKQKIFKNFIDIKNIANINILKCYKSLFSIRGFKHNIGSFSIILIILFHIICIFIFYYNQLDKIKQKIDAIIAGITNRKLYKNIIKEKNKISANKIQKKFTKKSKKKKKIKYQLFKKDNSSKKNKKIKNINFNSINMNYNLTENSKNNIISINGANIYEKAKEIMKYNEQELNEMNFKQALKYDKRNYCEFYFSLIKTKHDLIFSFCYNNDYNSKIIKIDLFFISIAMNFTINALFFNDDTMHKIYEDKGKFEFLYQLPQIIYSSIISQILYSLLQLLALSDDLILMLKQKKKNFNKPEIKIKLLKRLKIKFILFFIISTIFLVIFWYYISMFCAIYVNTQMHLIKDTLISFGMSLLYPFGIYLLPGIFRIVALSNKNKKSKKNKTKKIIFIFSKFLQFF